VEFGMLVACVAFLLAPAQAPTPVGCFDKRPALEDTVPQLVFREVEILARGPVHEAYAAAGAGLNFSGNRVVHAAPPAPLVEIPPGLGTSPTQVWIPGYWELDTEDNTWIWVSGCWREPPIGFGWLPGYWAQVRANQWRRVSGLWWRGDGDSFMLQYTPAPPQAGPATGSGPPRLDPRDPKNKGLFFSPGGWDWNGNRYGWRPGRLERLAENLIWQEQRQTWTPAGFLPCEDHIDHRLNHRGVAYAPLRPVVKPGAPAPNPVAEQTVEAVQPAGVWNTNAWLECSWRDRLGNYYIGDYYNPIWAKNGFVPARDARRRHGDPWLQSIEELAGADDATLRALNARHNERARGREQPPPRVARFDQPPPAGETLLVLPAGRLDPSDQAAEQLVRMALEVVDHQNRLIRARMELEQVGLEGKRVQLKTPPPIQPDEMEESQTPIQPAQSKK
jgi:hypothetical protein